MRFYTLFTTTRQFARITAISSKIVVPTRRIQSTSSFPYLRAGHSHWQNIKATKMAKDKVKCNMISQYVGKIRKCIIGMS